MSSNVMGRLAAQSVRPIDGARIEPAEQRQNKKEGNGELTHGNPHRTERITSSREEKVYTGKQWTVNIGQR